MRILNLIILSLLLLAVLPSTPARAAGVDLYSGEAQVEDQSAQEQQRAMPLALQQVMQKLTGLNNFEEYPELAPALKNARSLAITFYYRNRQFTLPDGEQDEELYLVAEFSKPAVDELAQNLKLPRWEPDRRPLTVWLLVDDGLSRRIMPIELEYAWESIAATAQARGLPLLRPVPDEEGQYPVDAQLLWGGYTDELTSGGPADALVIAARREGPEWNVRMNLDYMGEIQTWRNRNIDILLALQEGINTAIDEIVALNSIAASDQGMEVYEMTVTGIHSSARYAQCLAYLNGLSVVERVKVFSAAAGKVQFLISLNALPDYFLRAVEADGVLSNTDLPDEFAMQP